MMSSTSRPVTNRNSWRAGTRLKACTATSSAGSANAASAILRRSGKGPQKLRVRGHAPEKPFLEGRNVTLQAIANGSPVGNWTLDRNGLLILEADLPDSPEYRIDITAPRMARTE